MDCGEIIEEYLIKNGFDGLCTENCGCGIEDLFSCGDVISDCLPAYKSRLHCQSCENEDCHLFGSNREDGYCYSVQKPKERSVLNHTTIGNPATVPTEPPTQICPHYYTTEGRHDAVHEHCRSAGKLRVA